MIYANVGPDGVIVFEPHADPTLGRLPVGHATNRDAKRFKEIVSVIAVTRAQWHVAEMLIELNANSKPYVQRFDLHLAENGVAYGKRIEEMLQRAGFNVVIAEEIVPEGSTIQ